VSDPTPKTTPRTDRTGRFKPTWPTRLGALFVALIIAVGMVAIVLSNNLLYLIVAMMLGFVTASGILAEYTLTHLALRMRPPSEPFAGTATSVEIELTNEKVRFPSLCLCAREASTGPFGPDRLLIDHVPAGDRIRAHFTTVFPRRGWHDLEGMWISTRFPFAFYEKAAFLPSGARALVYPAPAVAPVLSPWSHSTLGQTDRVARGHGNLVGSVRTYVPGDPLRLVHWKLSARSPELCVKQLELETERRLVLCVAPLSGTELEGAVSIATGLLIDMEHGGVTTTLVTHEVTVGPSHGQAHLNECLRHLALVGAGPADWSPALLPVEESSSTGVVVVHAAGRCPPWATALGGQRIEVAQSHGTATVKAP
jgi:uncharacterized protein (DUF58 family)